MGKWHGQRPGRGREFGYGNSIWKKEHMGIPAARRDLWVDKEKGKLKGMGA